MTDKLMLSTFVGAFIFPFMISMCWGKLVESFGAVGGWLAAAFIVGTVWSLNHGMSMILQSGEIWIDMAWAAGTGLLAGGIYSGDSFKKAIPTVICSVIGGVLGGFILSTFLPR
jgi:hypothetical protein